MHFTELVRLTLLVALVHLGWGALFAVFLHARGLATLDPGTRRAGFGFRLLVTPGLMILWPVLFRRYLRVACGKATSPESREPDFGPTPAGLRRAHALAWKALAFSIPVILGAALYGRPAQVVDPPLPLPAPAGIAHHP